MEKKKRQQFTEGAVVKIKLSGNRFAFGRLLPGFRISIYDLVIKSDTEELLIEDIIRNKIILYVVIYKSIITKGIFEIVGFKYLTQIEIDKIPPVFMQSLGKYEDCTIIYSDGSEYKALPKECVGLERSSIWDEHSLVERIENYYNGKKNFHVEYQKVILSEDDPRYLNPRVRWDFKKERFYRE